MYKSVTNLTPCNSFIITRSSNAPNIQKKSQKEPDHKVGVLVGPIWPTNCRSDSLAENIRDCESAAKLSSKKLYTAKHFFKPANNRKYKKKERIVKTFFTASKTKTRLNAAKKKQFASLFF